MWKPSVNAIWLRAASRLEARGRASGSHMASPRAGRAGRADDLRERRRGRHPKRMIARPMSGGGPRRVHPIRAMRDARGSIRLGPSLVPGLVALVAVDDSEALIDRDARARRAMREARTEAVIVVGIDVALIVGLAVVDKAKGWQIIDLPWWAWLLLAAPALLLMILLLVVPLAELSPGRVRNVGVALLGLLAASDALGVAVLLVALAGSSAGSLSAGDLLAHGMVVWLSNIITFGLLFWQLDEGGPRLRAERGRGDPDFEFPQDTVPRPGWSPRLSDYLYVSLTNAIAVSPTDTMPLTRRAKGLMAVESLISYVVVILVVARAVNVLGA